MYVCVHVRVLLIHEKEQTESLNPLLKSSNPFSNEVDSDSSQDQLIPLLCGIPWYCSYGVIICHKSLLLPSSVLKVPVVLLSLWVPLYKGKLVVIVPASGICGHLAAPPQSRIILCAIKCCPWYTHTSYSFNKIAVCSFSH